MHIVHTCTLSYYIVLSSVIILLYFALLDVIHPLYTEVTTADNQTVYYNKHNGWYVPWASFIHVHVYISLNSHMHT